MTENSPDRSAATRPRPTLRAWLRGPAPAVSTAAGLAVRLLILAIATEVVGLATAWPGWVRSSEPPGETLFTILFNVIFVALFVVVPVYVTGGTGAMRSPVPRRVDTILTIVLVVVVLPAFTTSTIIHSSWPYQVLAIVDLALAIAAIPVCAAIYARTMPQPNPHDSSTSKK